MLLCKLKSWNFEKSKIIFRENCCQNVNKCKLCLIWFNLFKMVYKIVNIETEIGDLCDI